MKEKPTVVCGPHEEFMQEKVKHFFPLWITPNQITVARTLLLIPSILYLIYGQDFTSFTCREIDVRNLIPALICGVALYGDALDGVLARARGLCTPFGAVLDAMMDKVFIISYLLFMVIAEEYSEINYTISIFFITIILLVILIELVLGAVRIKDYFSFKQGKKEGNELLAVKSGKLKLCLEAAGVIGLILSYPTINIFGYVGLTCLFFSIIFASMSLISKISR